MKPGSEKETGTGTVTTISEIFSGGDISARNKE